MSECTKRDCPVEGGPADGRVVHAAVDPASLWQIIPIWARHKVDHEAGILRYEPDHPNADQA